ncbi:Hypothetical predicted protein [Mytilus galloprovincialis]|uniref:Uncharacterized protein n=1 Tax=Mytilus galloprovincialis TaxID=29158 RepID=A0A8B6ERK4_MYTGA|nr:Hypothetical predicted protein [Mytilus galloprovincialis]
MQMCSIFNTKHWCPGTLGIDAFNRQWGKDNNWIVPPPSDISRSPYWPLLHKVYGNVVEFESFIKDSKILPSTVIKKGRGRNGMFGKSTDFRMLAMKIRYRSEKQGVGANTRWRILSADFDELGHKMSSYLLQSRSDNTNNKYFYAYKRWERFILKQGGLSLPAKPIHVALYLTKLIDTGSSYSVVQSAFYGIKWAHTVQGFSDPTENAFVTNLLESSKRQPHKPKVKKEHIDSESIIELCKNIKTVIYIAILRDLCMIVLSFSGFLRLQ